MANEFIARKGIVVSGASQQALRTVGNGNILIGSGSTDSGYNLQVLGGTLLKGSGTTSSGSSLTVQNNSNSELFKVRDDGQTFMSSASGPGFVFNTALGTITTTSSNELNLDGTSATNLMVNGGIKTRVLANGNVLIGTTTDVGYKLYVNGTVKISSTIQLGGNTDMIDPSSNSGFMTIGSNQPIRFTNASSTEFLRITTSGNVVIGDTATTAKLQVTGSITASSSIALGVFFNNTLTAAANGDTLIGLDVRPTFSVGSYSGYTLLSLRSSGDTLFTTTGGTNTLRTFRTGNVLVGSGSTDLGSTLSVIGSSLMSGNTSGSTLLNVVGSQGQLFSVVDTLTGSLMSVNDISGLPILEVFSDDRVVMGEYATNALVVSGRSTGFGVTPSDANYRIISSGSTLFSGGTMIVKGSGTTSSSTAFVVQNSSGGTLLNLFNNGNLNIDNGALYVNGDTGDVGIGTSNPLNKLHISGSPGDIVYIVANTGQSAVIGATGSGTNRMYIGYSPGTENISITSGNVVRLNSSGSGNVLIGTTTDAGYKLEVNGTLRVNNTIFFNTASATAYIQWNGTALELSPYSSSGTIDLKANNGRSIRITGDITNGTSTTFQIPFTYTNSSGTGTATFININPTINNTGTYSGTVRGLYYNPTLTSLSGTTHRAIETVTGNVIFGSTSGNVLIGRTTDSGQKLQVSGTSLFTGTLTNLSGESSGQLFSMDLSQSAVTGNTIYAINVSPTLRNTASGQTQVALRVMPTFTGSSTGTSTTNKIVDFGSQNVGTQFTVTDATTGDIYMVNDVSGLPIIAANSSWDVSMYNYPNTVFKKTNNSILLGVQNNTGSTVSIYGDLIINEGFGFTNTTTQVSGTTSTGATSAVTIYTLTTSTNKSYSVSCLTTGYGTSTRNTTSGKVEGTFKNSGGTLSMVGTTIQYVSADIVSTNVDFELSGSSIVLRVTGTTTENYTWGSTITSQVI